MSLTWDFFFPCEIKAKFLQYILQSWILLALVLSCCSSKIGPIYKVVAIAVDDIISKVQIYSCLGLAVIYGLW